MMNKYKIKQKIKTPANLSFFNNDFSYEEFNFCLYDDKERLPFKREWVTNKIIEADNMIDAINEFRNQLVKVLDLMFVFTQCSFNIIGQSFLVIKENNNPKNIVYFYYAEEKDPVGMEVTNEFKDEMDKLKKGLGDKIFALSSWHMIAHTMKSRTRLFSQIITVESLIDSEKQTTTCNQCNKELICSKCSFKKTYSSTSKKKLKEILGDKLYKKLYTEDRIRHKLFHGEFVENSKISEVIEPMYGKIIDYFKDEYGVNVPKIKIQPRGFNQFNYSDNFIRLVDGSIPEIEDLEKVSDKNSRQNYKIAVEIDINDY